MVGVGFKKSFSLSGNWSEKLKLGVGGLCGLGNCCSVVACNRVYLWKSGNGILHSITTRIYSKTRFHR
jgi:hypothetical protein